MKTKKLISPIVLFLLCVFCVGQERDSLSNHDTISSNIKLAYNSSLIYPGVRLGIEIPLSISHVISDKKNYTKEQFLSANLGWYHHPQFHDNLYISAGWIVRRTKISGFFTEFSPELGYSRTFLGGTTYKVNDNGEVSIDKLAGYSYALILVGGGIGYDFSKQKHWPLATFLKANMLCLFPYNSTIYLRPTLEIGFIYKPIRFLRFVTKTKQVVK